VLARSDNLEQAEQLAREAVAVARGTDFTDGHRDTLRNLATVLVAAGKPEEARAAAEGALESLKREESVRIAEVRCRAGPSGLLRREMRETRRVPSDSEVVLSHDLIRT